MDIDYIIDKLKNKKARFIKDFKEFSVVVPLVKINNSLNILFEVRSHNLSQPGEVSLPGGAIEEDEDHYYAALRELNEEIGILPENVEKIAELDYFATPFNFVIYPYLVYIKDFEIKDLKINPDEVSEVFFVPLDYFFKTKPLEYKVYIKMNPPKDYPYHLIPNGKNYNWRKGYYKTYFYQYKNKVIWGLTARIIYDFIKQIRP
jgi:8-oxo-dGTP pyrophosphatase MutT (NUDIX family)